MSTTAADRFLDAAVWHGSLDDADAILAEHRHVATSSIHVAAVLGDHAAIAHMLMSDATAATRAGGPRNWPPLLYLALSKYLRLDLLRAADFVRTAGALLDAGADPNTVVVIKGERETVLYGAAGVAHHAALTELLLARGANPDDEEVAYHAPETDDLAALAAVVETGRVSPHHLALMLLRKADWHDTKGIRYLLAHGADANGDAKRGWRPLHQAIERDNALTNIELLLDAGADPQLRASRSDRTAVSIAVRRGRRDVLELFERRGVAVELQGADRLLAACARDDGAVIAALAAAEPRLVREVTMTGAAALAEFAGNGNTAGVMRLLDLGVAIDARYRGDGYWNVPPASTALHVAAWRAQHDVVRLLIERGATIDAVDGSGRTPLALAVKACVDSHWKARRSPESVRLLLAAGASRGGVGYPSGYPDVDLLLESLPVHD